MEIIQGPGEYEVSGVKIRGVNLEKESDKKNLRTMYLVQMDDLNLCILGPMNKNSDESFLEDIDNRVDVLFIDGEIDAKKMASLIKNLDSRLVVCRSESNAKILSKELGQPVETTDRLNVKRKDLSEEETKLLWLTEK